MGRKAGIDLDDVIDAAVTIADADGLDAVTLARVAAGLGIKPPSLYNHVAGLAGLRRLLSFRAAEELTTALDAALADKLTAGRGEPGGDRAANVVALAEGYRRFARVHPGLYQALLPAPIEAEDPELAAAFWRSVEVLAAALGVEKVDAETVHQLRAIRALLHGFVDLEAKKGFGLPVDLDQSFQRAVQSFAAGIDAAGPTPD